MFNLIRVWHTSDKFINNIITSMLRIRQCNYAHMMKLNNVGFNYT